MISDFINKNKLGSHFESIANTYFKPLAEEIKLHHASADKTYFVGINGSQGSGKSTLADFIQTYLVTQYQLNVVIMSLDDFYYNQIERAIIAADVHPLFTTRGVPGTHNTAHLKKVLEALSTGKNTIIPRFDKATDNPYPEKLWTNIDQPVDIVLVEGWCWGVPAQTYPQLAEPINTFEAQEDPDSLWRTHANIQLALQYQPLYHYMHKWIMLQAPSFATIFNWRLEQEQKLIHNTPASERIAVMNASQLQRFIQHYQRLTEHGFVTLPETCDHVYQLNSQRIVTGHKRKVTDA